MESELTSAIKRKDVYWRTKSIVQWLQEGDKNTRFFHAQTMKRRRRNCIRGLEEDDGTWCNDRLRIHGIAIQYFQSLFSSDRQVCFGDILPCVPCKVGVVNNNFLIAPVNDVEIENAIYQIHLTKSPGLDGFNAGFFQHHWETIGEVVMGMVKNYFQSRRMLKELNHTNIVLIPKVDNPTKMSQFRPISLCNVVYKVISKVLTNRLKRVLPNVISQNQSAFVAGRQIFDNILVVHELLYSMKQRNDEGINFMA